MRPIRTLLLLLGVIALLIAGVALAGEIMSFVVDGTLFAKPLGTIWFELHRNSLLLLQPGIERYLHPWLWSGIIQPLLELPPIVTTGAFGILGLALVWIGRSGRSRA